MKKRRAVQLASIALVAACLLFLVVPWRPIRVTRAHLDQVAFGMTEQEVLAILGPPDSETIDAEEDSHVKRWVTDEFTVGVYFGEDGRVIGKTYREEERKSWVRKVADRLGISPPF